MFGTMDNINCLQLNEHWFADGTFKVAPSIFYQVFTSHALIDHKSMPLVYCLIQDKAEVTYKRVFERIKELQPTLNPASIMSDFEKATHNAIQHVFPNWLSFTPGSMSLAKSARIGSTIAIVSRQRGFPNDSEDDACLEFCSCE